MRTEDLPDRDRRWPADIKTRTKLDHKYHYAYRLRESVTLHFPSMKYIMHHTSLQVPFYLSPFSFSYIFLHTWKRSLTLTLALTPKRRKKLKFCVVRCVCVCVCVLETVGVKTSTGHQSSWWRNKNKKITNLLTDKLLFLLLYFLLMHHIILRCVGNCNKQVGLRVKSRLFIEKVLIAYHLFTLYRQAIPSKWRFFVALMDKWDAVFSKLPARKVERPKPMISDDDGTYVCRFKRSG
jgi:hypothetical protein